VKIALPWAGLAALADRSAGPRAGDEWRVELGRIQVIQGSQSPITAVWTWANHGVEDLHIPECYPHVRLGA
jgi:hypothetical protein